MPQFQPSPLISLPDQSEPQLVLPKPGEGGSEPSADPAEPRSATTNRRRVGMVARLPYAVRHKLNILTRPPQCFRRRTIIFQA